MLSDGLHRVCIASKKGLILRARVAQIRGTCPVCCKVNIIQTEIKNAEYRVKRTTPKNTIFHKILKIQSQSNSQDDLDKLKKKLSDYQLEKERDFKEF